MSERLTKLHVLAAVARALAPKSAYIAIELHRAHIEHVGVVGKGHPPRRGLILSRLRSLEADGMLECTGGPDGYYGYSWRITDAGRAALAVSERQRGSDQ